MSMMLGSAFTGFGVTSISEVELFENFYGWKLSFILVGLFTAGLGPLIYALLKEPLVKVDPNAKGGVMAEMQTLMKLMKKLTFAFCVVQGCFGLIPWKAFEFRTFFFQTAGIENGVAGLLNSVGMFAGAFGNLLGGIIGDCMGKLIYLHGRVLTAEISIFGGIPIAYFTFIPNPDPSWAFWYYFVLVVALGFIGTWTPAGANSPILCSISSESERSLVLAWQTSLEGAIGALGPVMFTTLLKYAFNYDKACMSEKPPPKCESIDNAGAAGQALFWTSCFPWTICGLIYSCMHCTYPKDLKTTQQEAEQKETSLQMALQGGENQVDL